MKSSLLSTIFLAALSPGLAGAEGIREVTIFGAGLAEISRDLGPGPSVTLRVPGQDLSDILKTLSFTGKGDARLGMPSSAAVNDAFAALPLRRDQLGSAAEILGALTGHAVDFPDLQVGGRVLGIEAVNDCQEGACPALLTIITDDGDHRRFPVPDDVRYRIREDALRAGLDAALLAIRTDSGGEGLTDVDIFIESDPDGLQAHYIVTAPVWKTAYRAVTRPDGTTRIEAWAVIENAGTEDWDDIRLTLSSGSPRAISARLYEQEWAPREDYASASMKGTGLAQGRNAVFAEAQTIAFAMDSISAAPPDTTAAEGASDTRFTFSAPISVPAGRILSMPFAADGLEGRRYLSWAGSEGSRTGAPEMRLELRNSLPVRLPAGIMTIREAELGFVGDAAFPMAPPGETVSVRFGDETRMTVTQHARHDLQDFRVAVSDDGVTVSEKQVIEVSYEVSGTAPGVTGLEIEHPLREGWTTVAEGAAGLTSVVVPADGGGESLKVSLPLDENGDGRALVRSEDRAESFHAISAVDAGLLQSWLARRDLRDDDRAWMGDALSARLRQTEIDQEIADLARDRDLHAADQARISSLLPAFSPGSPDYQGFATDITALEAKIRDADKAALDLREERRRLDDRISAVAPR